MDHIMKGFGLEGQIKRLLGGQNTSLKVGSWVVKPVDNPVYYEWVLSIFDTLTPKDYRISRPKQSIHKSYVYGGHMVCAFEPGEARKCHIEDKLQVAKALHRDLKGLSFDLMPRAKDPWSKAHRVVWGDEDLILDSQVDSYIKPLLTQLTVRTREDFQIIHSDLYGNILFHETLNPLVIDFSPTIGPVAYGEAIMMCDGIAWDGCPLDILSTIDERELILRAVLFRLVTVLLFPFSTFESFLGEYKSYEKILEWYDGCNKVT